MATFNIEHHSSQLINRGEEVFHNVDFLTTLDIFGESFDVLYQCGMTYIANDYNRPSTELGVSDNSTDDLIIKLDQLFESDIENIDDEDFEEYKDLCSAIKTKEDLMEVYMALNDLTNEAEQEFQSYKLDNELSDNASDYDHDEETGLAIKKDLM